MGRKTCPSKKDLNRGAWTAEEDMILTNSIHTHGDTGWRSLAQKAGLNRCEKSCRLRWLNYLRPGIKRGNICADEEELIIRMHRLLGNRWALIAGRLPGRTDNEIKNYWNTHLSKKLAMNSVVNSTSQMPMQTYTDMKDRTPSSLKSSEDDGATPSEIRSGPDNELDCAIPTGDDKAVDVSKLWNQLLQDSTTADLADYSLARLPTDIQNENGFCSTTERDSTSSSQLNNLYPLDCNPLPFPSMEDLLVESLLQPRGFDLEGMCHVQSDQKNFDRFHNFEHTHCLAMAGEEGIKVFHNTMQCPDWMQQQKHFVEQSKHVDLDEEKWEDQVDLTTFSSSTPEEECKDINPVHISNNEKLINHG